MSQRFIRFFAAAMLVVSAGALLTVSFDAEARRFGGGRSFGRQSSNITQQRAPVTPPAAASATQRSAAPAAGAAAGTAAGTAAKSGMSRFLGPIAGIAAGLGIAALLSHLGLGGAFLEMLSSMVLIGLVIFAVLFIVRRLRGAAGASPAMQGSGGHGAFRQGGASRTDTWREATASAPAASAAPAAAPQAVAPQDSSWFIPADFDTQAFLVTAKKQFTTIQGVWDSGDLDRLADYLTDDLIAEFKPQILAREGKPQVTEVVLLNAELLGIEAVAGGHLASVRYSGMLREEAGAEAFRFEEVWNLYKAQDQGWLLAGIQQIPVGDAG